MNENAPQDAAARLASFYRETILHHTANPVGFRAPINATHRGELYNPTCGDRVIIQFEVANDRIEAAAFDGESCGICMASASMLCEHAQGQPASAIRHQHDWLERMLRSESEPGPTSMSTESSQPLQALLGVRRYPTRINCALLPWQAALKALDI